MTNGGERVPDDAIAFNGDTGHRVHNVYPLLYSQCLHEAAARFAREPDALPISLCRAGWAGSQRFPVGSGGAPQSDWEGLAASIRGALSWGMSGAPYHAAAVGGTYGPPPPAELWLRALQARVFSSHMLLHGGDGCAALGLRRRRRGDRKKMARVPVSAAAVSATGHRRGDAERAAGDARDGARVSRQRARPRLRNAVHVRRRAAGRADRRAGRRQSRSRCRRARGTTSIRASASPGLRVLRYRAALDQFPGVRPRRLRACRSAGRRGTPARSTPRVRSTPVGLRPADAGACRASRRLRSARSRRRDDAHRRRARRSPSSCFGDAGRRERVDRRTRPADSGRVMSRSNAPRSRSPSASPPASGRSWSRVLAAAASGGAVRGAARRHRRHRRARSRAPRAPALPCRYATYDPAAIAPAGRRASKSGISRWRRRSSRADPTPPTRGPC